MRGAARRVLRDRILLGIFATDHGDAVVRSAEREGQCGGCRIHASKDHAIGHVDRRGEQEISRGEFDRSHVALSGSEGCGQCRIVRCDAIANSTEGGDVQGGRHYGRLRIETRVAPRRAALSGDHLRRASQRKIDQQQKSGKPSHGGVFGTQRCTRNIAVLAANNREPASSSWLANSNTCQYKRINAPARAPRIETPFRRAV